MRKVENSIGVVRSMALLLRPSMLDDLGLVPALQWQAREVSKRNDVRVKVAAEQVSEELPEEHKTCHLGGSFAVNSEPGQGAVLCVTLPLPETRETA